MYTVPSIHVGPRWEIQDRKQNYRN